MPSSLTLYDHDSFAAHDTGQGHPERSARHGAIRDALKADQFATVRRVEAVPATDEQIDRAHPPPHRERILAAIPETGLARIDMDTVVSPQSGVAARHAAGAVCQAVDAVLSGETAHGFCAVRPPGHHAEPLRAMGFCLFNNIAIGAKHALDGHGLERVAIVDFDVHHGNGTEAVARQDPRILFVSTHEWGNYPGTGAADDRGQYGNLVNLPLASGSDGAVFQEAMRTRGLPAVRDFAPDMILVSAGFDAHRRDPLGGLAFDTTDFAWITAELAELAARLCGGRLVSALEGGYDLSALAESVAAHVTALIEY